MWNLFRSIDSVARSLAGPWAEWIGPAPVQMSGMLSGHRAVVIVWWAVAGFGRFPLTFRFSVNSHLGHCPGMDSCMLTYCGSAAPMLSLQSFYNYARDHCEAARSFFRVMHSVHLISVEQYTALARGPRTILGYVGKRGWGVEGYWCFRKWVQWSPFIGGGKCGLIASNERDVESFLRLQRLLARFAVTLLFQACVRALISTFCMCVCIYVFVCMCADMYICEVKIAFIIARKEIM